VALRGGDSGCSEGKDLERFVFGDGLSIAAGQSADGGAVAGLISTQRRSSPTPELRSNPAP
jgi:hypothetical protein